MLTLSRDIGYIFSTHVFVIKNIVRANASKICAWTYIVYIQALIKIIWLRSRPQRYGYSYIKQIDISYRKGAPELFRKKTTYSIALAPLKSIGGISVVINWCEISATQ